MTAGAAGRTTLAAGGERAAADASAYVADAGGPELLERLRHLDSLRGAQPLGDRPLPSPGGAATADFDVLIVGGGLSLLLAPLLARRGLRVGVCDRGRIGLAHREWNGGLAELAALSATGLFAPSELEDLVVARYREGLCRWHGGGTYPVSGVLDHAIDAGRLLAHARRKAEEASVTLLDFQELRGAGIGEHHVRVELGETGDAASPSRTLIARVVVDARGAASPYATADILCPTVGGVLEGLAEGSGPREVDRAVGDILVTTEGVEDGRQHIWEGFPGRAGETTVYLFYYARRGDVPPGALVSLYARFLACLPRYKRGAARLLRPTFGVIPGWSRLAPRPTSPSPRWLLVGDAAALHSPLTFCGFGSLVRSLGETVACVERAALGSREMMTDTPLHAGTGFLSLLLATPPRAPRRSQALNALLDAAFASLHARGDAFYGRLLRDEMTLGELSIFLRETARRRPGVYLDVVRDAKATEVLRWASVVGRGALGLA